MENVVIIRSRKRSTVGIRILPDATVQVTIPFLYPKIFVKKILQEKKSWIEEKQQLMRTRAIEKKDKKYWYLGKQYDLVTKTGLKDVIEVSDHMYIGSASEKYRTTYLTSWYKKQARKIIFERVVLYAKKANASYRSINLTSAETRWGSCSSQKTLNFNWKLVMAPIEVIDYVVAHELAHLQELNHSRAFWEEVRKMYPLYREYRTWLKRYGHLLTI